MKRGTGAVRFVCTGRGRHTSKELALLGYMPDMDPELTQALRDAGLTEEALQRGIDNETVVVFFASERNGADRGIFSPLRGYPEQADSAEWRFPCPTCKRDAPMSHTTLTDLMRNLRQAGKSSFDLWPLSC